MSYIVNAFLHAKNKYLAMDTLNKRAEYYCGEYFTIWNAIPNWTEYSKKENIQPRSKAPGYDEKIFSVDEEINSRVSLWLGDITALEVDCAVNAANPSLLGGAGVDGAIHRAAGPDLRTECESLGGCQEGEAKITGGYKLPAKFIIHTVGPQEEKPDVLKACYENCLKVLVENNLRTIAFPSLSTGIYGYPIEEATHVAMLSVRHFLQKDKEKVGRPYNIYCIFSRTYQNF